MIDNEKNEQKPPKIEMVEVSDDGNYGKFVCEPLGRGYGITIGNSLRRMLLSSLEGTAVTSIRIDGVLHEFSTIPGVREDVTNIVLNIKQLCLKVDDERNQKTFVQIPSKPPKIYNVRIDVDSEKPFVQVISTLPKTYTLRIEVDVEEEIKSGKTLVDGRREVTAADIQCDPSIEILNPDLHIAWLNETGKLKIEMIARKGRGYDQSEKNKNPDDIIGTIPIDSIFSPVLRVNFNVEDTRVGNEMDFDKLTLEVWTNGTLSPEEAVAKASSILICHLTHFLSMDTVTAEEFEESKEISIKEQPTEDATPTRDKNLSKPIEELELSVRSTNCLKRAGIHNVADLVDKTEEEMKKFRNLGSKSLDEIKNMMSQLGVSFKPSPNLNSMNADD